MKRLESLSFGKYYHIYNCGINDCKIFERSENFEYFLTLYDHYISPIADTFAWALMPNHFHFLLRIKERDEITTHLSGSKNLTGLMKLKSPHQHFSNFFNAYTKAVNKRFLRHGALFERPFRRKKITSFESLKQTVLSIHRIPVESKYVKHPEEYTWSSYLTCISAKSTKLHRDSVIGWFGNSRNFKLQHAQNLTFERMEEWMIQTRQVPL
jgi:putative transposase